MDIQPAVAQRAGVGRYTAQLVRHLAAQRQADELALCHFDFMRRGLPFAVPGTIRRTVRCCPGRLAQAGWKLLGWPPYDVLAGAAEVYHFPNFILPPLRRGRAVVTVHDMSFLRYPQFAEPRNCRYLGSRIRLTVQRADAVITDSVFSAGEIEELLGVPRDRLHPIHLGIAGEFRPPPAETVDAVRRDLCLDRPYLLTVGTLEPRKNVAFLLDLFERLDDFDGCLVIAGMPGWKYEPLLARLRSSPRAADIRWLRYVPEDCLPALYAGAELFVLCSVYEGFGLPPLEAMACGTAVLSSTGGSLPEVLGDAALLVDGFRPEAWLAALRALLEDSDRRTALRAAGRARAGRYTWDAAARATWEVYRAL